MHTQSSHPDTWSLPWKTIRGSERQQLATLRGCLIRTRTTSFNEDGAQTQSETGFTSTGFTDSQQTQRNSNILWYIKFTMPHLNQRHVQTSEFKDLWEGGDRCWQMTASNYLPLMSLPGINTTEQIIAKTNPSLTELIRTVGACIYPESLFGISCKMCALHRSSKVNVKVKVKLKFNTAQIVVTGQNSSIPRMVK